MKGDRYNADANTEWDGKKRRKEKIKAGGFSFVTAAFYDDGTVELEAFPNGTAHGAVLNTSAMRQLRDLLDARLKENAAC